MIAQVMHLPHLSERPDLFEVTALCDLSQGTARAVAAQYGISRTYTNHRDMLAQADVDAVLVLTPNHARPAIDAARAGKHVLVEKPMCNNLVEADELIDAAQTNGVVGMVAYHKRYDPGYRAGRAAIQTLERPHLIRLHDVIGPNAMFLAHYDLIRVDDIDPTIIQRARQEQTDSLQVAIGPQPEAITRAYGLLLGLSTHDMTILHGVAGLPERVIAAEIWDNGLAIAAIFGYPGNLRCIFDTAITPKLRKFDESLTVYSDERVVSIVFPSPFLKNAPTLVEEWRMQGELYQEVRTEASYLEAFKEELIHFHGCIVEGKQPETPLEEGRAHIATLIEIVKQATA
jgi:predicted dehydrogenase